jgi:predicted PurR-regulated permease PerM
MAVAQSGKPGGSALVPLLVGAGVIVAFYYGRDILIPFALAALLTFVLAPLASRIRRLGVPRVPAVLSVVLLAFVVLGGVGLLVGGQVVDLVEKLPTYRQNIASKIRSIREGVPGGGILDRAAETIRDLERELESTGSQAPGAAPQGEKPAPEVRVREEKSTLAVLGAWAVPLLGPLGTAGLVVVFVIFFLLGREDLRNRVIRLIGGDLNATTDAFDEAAQRVSRYLLTQLVINVGTSIPFGIALYFIGVPNALLWAVLAAALRFIPYIGPLIAAMLPAALAAAVDPGWGMLLWTLGVYIAMEAITNNVIEPRFYGASTGISEVAIIMSAIFWTALWGPVGLFLATPLTVCLAVMGRHIPQLEFLDVLLGKSPVLSPVENFYQRMLAGDPVEGEQIAETFIKEKPVAAFYEEVALPALGLAERDRQRAALAPERRATITETVLEVIDDLEDADDGKDKEQKKKEDQEEKKKDEVEKKKDKAEKKKDKAEKEDDPTQGAAPVTQSGSFVCLAARTGFDFAAASALAQLLRRRGFEARALPTEAVSIEGIPSLDVSGTDAVYLCYVGFANTAHARHLLRRLRRRAQGRPIVVAFWPRELRTPSPEALAEALTPARVVRSVEQALAAADELTQPRSEAFQPPAVPSDEEKRRDEPRRPGLLDTPVEERFDHITSRLAKAFGAPISLVSLADEDSQPPDLAKASEGPPALSVCSHVFPNDEVLVVDDVLKDKRFADNPLLRERGIRFYAGAPLRGASGATLGSVCVIDVVPHKSGERDRDVLELAAREVVEEIERGAKGAPAADQAVPTAAG